MKLFSYRSPVSSLFKVKPTVGEYIRRSSSITEVLAYLHLKLDQHLGATRIKIFLIVSPAYHFDNKTDLGATVAPTQGINKQLEKTRPTIYNTRSALDDYSGTM